MKLRFTIEAANELDQILEDIALQSPQGARRVRERIQAAIETLLGYPRSGRLTSVRKLRRVVATPYPDLIFYQPTDTEIVVIGIRHAARHPSSMPDRV